MQYEEKSLMYSFTVNQTVEKPVETKSKNAAGEEVVTVVKVKEQKPVKFAILKPNRKLREQAELFQNVKIFEYLNAGLLSKALLAKRYLNDGGTMSEPEKQRYSILYLEMMSKEDELEKCRLNLENLTEDQKKEKLLKISGELIGTRNELQDISLAQSALFNNTAEALAEKKTAMWWVVNLAVQENEKAPGKFEPVFGDGDFDARILKSDEMEEKEDLFTNEVLKKFSWYVGMWFNGQINSKEDFDEITKAFTVEPETSPVKVEVTEGLAETETAKGV